MLKIKPYFPYCTTYL